MKIPYEKKCLEVEHLKVKRRLYGAYWTLESGKRLYVAYRSRKEIFRSGHSSLLSAIRHGEACWALDVDTIKDIEARGVSFVGVLVKETQELYLTTVEQFKDKSAILNYESSGGAIQRYVPLQFFKKKALA